MKVAAFLHVPFEGLGRIERALESHGIEYRPVASYAGEEAQETEQADGLIFMGGPMSVNDDLPWLRAEELLAARAAERGVPLLGVCLGAQLIARALGARVYRNPVKEIGWFEIERTAEGAADPLLGELAPRETVFHWHGETFDLPKGAALLASSRDCRNQAFRWGEAVYGLQFHLEATPAMIEDWCAQDANCGDVRELDGPIDAGRDTERLDALSARVFGNWCELVRRRTSGRSVMRRA